jgi:outer membrane lipoprotein-sorting protein
VDTVSSFRSRPALRWLVPAAAAVVVIGGGAAAGTLVANAQPSLPKRSAAQLLVDLQNAKVDGFSGTVVQRSDLGLPGIAGLAANMGAGNGGSEITRLVSGSNTARVWYAGEDKARVALMDTAGETDLIHNGKDVWIWRSQEKSATHMVSSGDAKAAPEGLPSGLTATPQDAAAKALAAIDPTTSVTTTGGRKVAGRPAYELVLAPRDTASLVSQVRLAIDAEHHIPLSAEVYAKGAADPSIRVAFEQISFTKPDAEQFVFNAPPGTKVDTKTDRSDAVKPGTKPGAVAKPNVKPGTKPDLPEMPAADRPKVVGTGWTSVVVAKLPKEALAPDLANKIGAGKGDAGKGAAPADVAKAKEAFAQVESILGTLPKVSGAWGSGRLLSGKLFTALLTDDGRVLVGAVAPEKLYEVAASK